MARDGTGITQRELATEIGVDLLTLRRWEGGHTQPRAAHIVALCQACGVTESQLLSGVLRSPESD